MASPVTAALQQAEYTGSSEKRYYWAFKHPNPDAPPHTYRLCRRAGNGWAQLLAASKQTKEVLAFFAETPDDQQAVTEALLWLGIKGLVGGGPEGTVLRLSSGATLPSFHPGGEKPKKKQA
ncbi:MAG: hypothetical protein K0R39_4532 [Symbiobacteriaceae bacterium]|jgi:hypothetical protein|nr:hypothetical protein [Symbiobacteriaceae bacterium]